MPQIRFRNLSVTGRAAIKSEQGASTGERVAGALKVGAEGPAGAGVVLS